MEWIKTDEAAVEKLKQMIEGLDICMLVTADDAGKRHNRPMAAITIDNKGNCWFFASKSSGKVKDISSNNNLQIVFANPAGNDYIEIHAAGSMICDESEIIDKWSPLVSEWFPRGIKDPEVCLIKAEITNVFYWDEVTEGIQKLTITTTVVEAPRLAA